MAEKTKMREGKLMRGYSTTVFTDLRRDVYLGSYTDANRVILMTLSSTLLPADHQYDFTAIHYWYMIIL